MSTEHREAWRSKQTPYPRPGRMPAYGSGPFGGRVWAACGQTWGAELPQRWRPDPPMWSLSTAKGLLFSTSSETGLDTPLPGDALP